MGPGEATILGPLWDTVKRNLQARWDRVPLQVADGKDPRGNFCELWIETENGRGRTTKNAA
jgi:hypothetical protein